MAVIALYLKVLACERVAAGQILRFCALMTIYSLSRTVSGKNAMCQYCCNFIVNLITSSGG